LITTTVNARTAGVELIPSTTGGKYKVHFDVPYGKSYCAWAEFNDTLSEVGWGTLTVRGNHADPATAHYCSGVAEAALTHTRISQYFTIVYDSLLEDLGGSFPKKLSDWLEKSMAWTRKMAETHRKTDVYWESIYNILRRFDGMVEAYKEFRDPVKDVNMTDLQFIVMESSEDLDDLTFIISADYPELRKKISSEAWRDVHHHCTGLIYMEPSYMDVYVAHDTWDAYNTMNRILKDYEIASPSPHTAASRWTFSSNPGLLFSSDDFWLLNSGLVVIETTVNTWNTTLYDLYCKPESVLAWIRVCAVNLIAHNGQEWAKYFNIANSWTYNNQYLIVDTNKFTRGKKPKEGFVTCTEQVPGYYVVGDRTDELCSRRWIPSVNIPSYEKVYNASGYPEKVKETKCDYWTYERCPRHLIMKRDVINKIHSYKDFKTFMRYNDWQKDPLSDGDAASSIQSRYDLRPDECLHLGTMTMCPFPFGGLDAKTTNINMAKKLFFDAISSPVYENQPVWEFGTPRWKKVRYDGLPKVWKFPWIQFGPINH